MNDAEIFIPDALTFANAQYFYDQSISVFKGEKYPSDLTLDFGRVTKIDSAGCASIRKLEEFAKSKGSKITFVNCSSSIDQTLKLFSYDADKVKQVAQRKAGFFERRGSAISRWYYALGDILVLIANVFYWTFGAFFKKKLRRRGEVIHQSILIGVNALPIIGLIAFLIGFILALQSAAQLRQFGANIYVAHLLAIALVSEMGPLITAIMVAGRSGSAIAAEIATMVVTEEIDALKVMGIDPIPYLIVPKLLAICLTVPLLTVFANLIGIIGGMVIGVTYLDIEVRPFFNAVISVLRYKEIVISLLKSFTFALIIVLTGTHFGFKVRGGAEGVGRATTAAVVFSIFFVIIADSIIGMMFYFGEPGF